MAVAEALSPVQAVAVVGALGVGAQWLAWRFRLPSIVLMLAAGLLAGPLTGWFLPDRDLGEIWRPLIGLAVAVILFEGGMTLEYHRLGDARGAVQRLVYLGAPIGWALSSTALVLATGISWESAVVFGGVMVVTGPTVIAPMLRQAKLAPRPAQVLQWEAIVNDPIGVLIAVLGLEVVMVLHAQLPLAGALRILTVGIGFAAIVGAAAGYGIAMAFRRAWVPEYMKVPVLFALVVVVFALTDSVLHETGLLAVTIMGLVLANAGLPSYTELHRFKEHVTLLLVSGVFILLAASLDLSTLSGLNWHVILFVVLVIAVARPLQVLIPLIGSSLPMNERLLVASTGPRGVVMVSVSGLFGAKLVEVGIADGAYIAPLAFALVVATVLVHGFTLAPIARALGLSGAQKPGLLIVGGSPFATALARALDKAGVDALIADPNRSHLRDARQQGINTFYGDILAESAEHHVEFISYSAVLVASDNDAYNTLVATDLGPEFGREMIWQLARSRDHMARHSLPVTLGGKALAGAPGYETLNQRLAEGWTIRTTRLTEEYTLENWTEDRPGAEVLMRIGQKGAISFISEEDEVKGGAGVWLVSMMPPETASEAGATHGEIAPTSPL